MEPSTSRRSYVVLESKRNLSAADTDHRRTGKFRQRKPTYNDYNETNLRCMIVSASLRQSTLSTAVTAQTNSQHELRGSTNPNNGQATLKPSTNQLKQARIKPGATTQSPGVSCLGRHALRKAAAHKRKKEGEPLKRRCMPRRHGDHVRLSLALSGFATKRKPKHISSLALDLVRLEVVICLALDRSILAVGHSLANDDWCSVGCALIEESDNCSIDP
jgi:hypothetical protein